MSGASVEWDHQTVIGKKARPPKVARNESDVNGVVFVTKVVLAFTDPPRSRSYTSVRYGMFFFLTPCSTRLVRSALSSGRIRNLLVALIRLTKVPAQATYTFSNRLINVSRRIGTDHQKIAKIDRENEVAPPPKISLTVGRVRAFHGRVWPTF